MDSAGFSQFIRNRKCFSSEVLEGIKGVMLSKLVLIYLGFFLSVVSVMAGPETRVVIDPGHGGRDDGALWAGVREADLNLAVSKKLEALLLARNIPVTLTRRSDVFITLEQRSVIANSFEDVIFVSVHFNAHRMTSIVGVETFYASPEGKLLATNIQREVVERVKTRNRYIKSGPGYAVLNQAKCPAVLVECGFISNTNERKRCMTAEYQMLCAKGIEAGIMESLPALDKLEEDKRLEELKKIEELKKVEEMKKLEEMKKVEEMKKLEKEMHLEEPIEMEKKVEEEKLESVEGLL